MKLIHQSDWLGSKPYFYNTRTGEHGFSSYDLVRNLRNFSFHPEGLFNYLDFGYCVFGLTPIEGIRFLPPSAKLSQNEQKEFLVEKLKDPALSYLGYSISEDEIFNLVKERVNQWERSLPCDAEIILPLSGGLDSRLLLWSIENKDRIRAYTYGVYTGQNESKEVVFAKALANKYKVRWKQIKLGYFNNHIKCWIDAFGFSSHAHGMYQMEFYENISREVSGEAVILSGIVGDLWAGSISPMDVSRPEHLGKLSYSHGLRLNPRGILTKFNLSEKGIFFEEHCELLKEPWFQVVCLVRMKMMLLSYLLKVPELYGFKAWSPFLDIDIAMAMLNLNPARRRNRVWQKEFFKDKGLFPESWGLKYSSANNLNHIGLKLAEPAPLASQHLNAIFGIYYIQQIGTQMESTLGKEVISRIFQVPKLGGLLRRMGLVDIQLDAYYRYLCLKPLEVTLRGKKFTGGYAV